MDAESSTSTANVGRSHLAEAAVRAAPAFVAPLLLCGALLAQTAWFRASKSITFDETFYLGVTLQTVEEGRLDRRFAAAGVTPLPVLADFLPAAIRHGGQKREELWQGAVEDPPLVETARTIHSLLFGLPLVLVVYTWMALRRGRWAGAVAGGLCAFSPTVLAHASIATTDLPAALGALAALAGIALYLERPNWKTLLIMAGSAALAISMKYSGLFVVPLACLAVVGESARSAMAIRGSGQPRPGRRLVWLFAQLGVRLAALLVVFAVATWALHGFAVQGPLKSVAAEATPADSPWARLLGQGPRARWVMDFAHQRLPMPSPLAGLLAQYQHMRQGHPAFLLGERSSSGWWSYFPLAVLWKSTPVELMLWLWLAVAGVAAGWWSVVRRRLPPAPSTARVSEKQEPSQGRASAVLVWTAAMLAVGFLALSSRLNLGQRYVLVLYPLLFLLAVDTLWSRLRGRPRLLALFGSVLVAGQAASALAIGPDYLAYFNRPSGGPAHAYRLLVDSNLDWGQDLPALRQRLEERQYRRVLLHYFGSAAPEAYGIRHVRLEAGMTAIPTSCDWLAVSATHLVGAYNKLDHFEALRALEPQARAGYSMLLYDLGDPDARQALEQALRGLAREAESGAARAESRQGAARR